MRGGANLLWAGIVTVWAIVLLVNYTNAENRKLYAECLRITERLLDADPKRISTPFCSLR